MPNISVVIPTYNCSKYLIGAIDSVLNQTYSNLEVIVVDDGSKDNTKQILGPYIDSKKIKYFYQENKGPSSARNKGIREAAGKYIAFLDADDLWLDSFLSKMLLKIEEGYDWVVCDNIRESIDINTNTVMDKKLMIRQSYDSWTTDELLKAFLIKDMVGSPNKILVRRNCLINKNVFFDESLRSREDWDFVLQLLESGYSLGLVKEALVVYRIRNDNSNSTRRMGSIYINYTLMLLEKHTEFFLKLGMKSILGQHYYEVARDFFYKKHDIKKTLICVYRVIMYSGFKFILIFLKNKYKKLPVKI
jgi:glycosyltransferase involved in cell wall biosynthesis